MTTKHMNHATRRCYFTDFEVNDVLLLDGFFVGSDPEDEVRCAWVVRKCREAYLVSTGEHFFFLDKMLLRSGKIAASVCGHIGREEEQEQEFPPRLAA